MMRAGGHRSCSSGGKNNCRRRELTLPSMASPSGLCSEPKASLWKYSGHVLLGGSPEDSGGIIYSNWSVNASGSPRRGWERMAWERAASAAFISSLPLEPGR
ncbi:unnamed protein product [Pleuronectes platessa]|uniref:Uncharacterized protein n=1 Tax=Pleuronectes platessa TaxID=8262 RepID=A0A9N7TSN3_PLEPL|nr:unnamed protein product [Pleuronectes platessa]